MAFSLDHFIAEISASGLAPEGELRAAMAAISSGDQPVEPEQLARELARRELLTPYQLQQLHAGQGKSLAIGSYVVLDKLGQGGMGVVLKARHKRMDRLVALKLLAPQAVGSADAIERFHREVRAAARLIHPNIVTAFDADEAAGTHFFAMEYVEGSDLSRLVKQQGPLSIDAAVRYTLQAARGLAYAHEQGIVHRDIKPSNLLLDGKGNVKILDMGLARIESAAGVQAELTGSGQIMGTVDYMSPEQALNTRKADHRADIYSLGITLWYLLTGRAAYEGETVMERMMAHQTAPIPSLAEACPGVSAALDAAFRRMVAKNVADRFQSMDEVIAALERCRGGDFSATTSYGSTDGAGRSPLSSSAARSGAILSPAPSRTSADELDATIDSGGGQIDTDPETQTHLRAPLPLPPKDLGDESIPFWRRSNTFLLAGIGVIGLAGLLMVFLIVTVFARWFGPARIEIPQGGSAKIVSEPSIKAQEWALDFDGKSTYVELPKLDLPEKFPITIEAIVTPRKQDSGLIVVTPDHAAGSIFHNNQKWFGRGWTSGSPTLADAVGAKVVPNRRVHLACTWDGKATQIYVDGQPGAEKFDVKVEPIPQKLASIGGGLDAQGKPTWVFDGLIHQVRFSRGLRYTKNFDSRAPMIVDGETIALYNCDENAGDVLRDVSPSKLDGRIVGAKWVYVRQGSVLIPRVGQPVIVAPVAGGNNALQFSLGSSVKVPTLKLGSLTEYTLEAMVIPANEGTDSFPRIVSFDDRAGLFLNKAGGWSFHNIGTSVSAILQRGPVVPGRRVHVAGVRSGSLFSLYLDGKMLTQQKVAVQSPPIDPELSIGTSGFEGVIDEIRISKIARYYNDFTPPSVTLRFASDPVCLAIFHFDEGAGAVLADSSPAKHQGKIIGAKWVSVVDAPATASLPYALEFDGVDDHVYMPNLQLDKAKSLTIELFVTPASHLDGLSVIAAFTGKAVLWDDKGIPSFNIRPGEPTERSIVVGALSPFEQGKEVHLAGVWDGQKVSFYVNGKGQEPSRPCPGVLDSTNPFSLGGTPNGVSAFRGRIRGAHVTTRVKYSGDFDPPPSPAKDDKTLALYDFHEGKDGILHDTSGNGHDGTIVGAKWTMVGKANDSPASIPEPPEAVLEFDGIDDFVMLPEIPYDRTSPFTFEAWVTPAIRAEAQAADPPRGVWASPSWIVGSSNSAWHHFRNGSNPILGPASAGSPVHLAAQWDGKAATLYIGGKRAPGNGAGDGKGADMPRYLGCVGNPNGNSREAYFQGRIGEIRLSKIVRHEKNFDPPPRHALDDDTLALYHADRPTTTELIDSSPNRRHGQIVGAKWGVLVRPGAVVPPNP